MEGQGHEGRHRSGVNGLWILTSPSLLRSIRAIPLTHAASSSVVAHRFPSFARLRCIAASFLSLFRKRDDQHGSTIISEVGRASRIRLRADLQTIIGKFSGIHASSCFVDVVFMPAYSF